MRYFCNRTPLKTIITERFSVYGVRLSCPLLLAPTKLEEEELLKVECGN